MDGTPVPAFQSRAVFHPTRYIQEMRTRLSCSEYKNGAEGRGDRGEATAPNSMARVLAAAHPAPGSPENMREEGAWVGVHRPSQQPVMSITVDIPEITSPSPSWINKERMVARAGAPWEACCLEMGDPALGS